MTAVSPISPTQPATAGSPPPAAQSAPERRDDQATETARPVTAPDSGQRSNAEDRDRGVTVERGDSQPRASEARSANSNEAESGAGTSEQRSAQNDRAVAEQRAETRNDRSQRGQTVDLFA